MTSLDRELRSADTQFEEGPAVKEQYEDAQTD
jgi:hypothetical protein